MRVAAAFALAALCVGCGGRSAVQVDADRAAERARWRAAAAALMNHGDLLGCRQTLTAQVKAWPEGSLTDDALWVLGHLARRLGQWSTARAWFAVLAHDRHGESWVVGSYRNARQPWAAVWEARLTWLEHGPQAAVGRYEVLLADDVSGPVAEAARTELADAKRVGASRTGLPDAWARVDLAALAREVGW